MQQLLDKYGHPVSLGSTLIYAVKRSTSVSLNYAYVYGIKLTYGSYSLSVVTMRTTWRGEQYIYRTVLTARNFLVTDIPEEIKAQLMKQAV